MIAFKFKGLEGGTISVNAPDRWSEVTVEHFCNPYFLSGDSISLLSVLSGIDRNTLLNSKEDITGQLLRMTNFIAMDAKGFNIKDKPKTFKLRGVSCTVPQDIEVERVGQKIMLQDAMIKAKFVYEAIPEAIAIYLQPGINNGVFDDQALPELVEEIKQLRIVDVYPIAHFFLTSWKSLMKNGTLY